MQSRKHSQVVLFVVVVLVALVAPVAIQGRPEARASDLDRLRLRPVVVGQFDAPIAIDFRFGWQGMYVAERDGRVRYVDGTGSTVVLDITAGVTTSGEGGLLGLAFSPDGTTLVVNFTDTAGDTRIWRYDMNGAAPDVSTQRQILQVDQPYSNHNGGHVEFGPDGMLYIGLGDGGSGGDPHDHGQNPDTLLGSLLRLDLSADPYVVPSDNPFADGIGGAPEVYAYGLRNPWRYSFDPETGALWLGDVGQNRVEEIDYVPFSDLAGANFGWARLEGDLSFSGSIPAGTVAPVHTYGNVGSQSVTGGRVYRSPAPAALDGVYLFGDFITGAISALRRSPTGAIEVGRLGFDIPGIVSFGTAPSGEMYAVSLFGTVYRLELEQPEGVPPAPDGAQVGLVDPVTGIWYLRGHDGSEEVFAYGNPGDVPFMGDWDCDGIDTPGLLRTSDGFVYLRNSNTQGVADREFFFGNPGDLPIVGDFNGDGCDTVSLYRPSEARFYIVNALGRDGGGLGAADPSFVFGDPGDVPLSGDFDGDRIDEVALHRKTTGFVYLRHTLTEGIADAQFFYGDPGDRMIAADWTADGTDTVGLFRPAEAAVYLRYANIQGNADYRIPWGESHWLPVGGRFGAGA